jgi:hypothetical protein
MANGSEKTSKRLPKPRVAGSNPVARSINPQVYQGDSHFPSVSQPYGRKMAYHRF